MMVQYVEGIPGIRLDAAEKKVTLDIEEATFGMEQVEAAYNDGAVELGAISAEHSRGLDRFCRRLEAMPAPRAVKGHVTGPVTLALSLETNYEARAAFYEPELARMIARAVGLKARYQEQLFSTIAPNAETIIFFDEPSMGSIGSAVLNLDANLAVELLSIASRACRSIPGIHCCGETDLGLIADAGVRVLNFDAFSYFESLVVAGPRVKTFVEGGGMLAIGLVPSFLPHPEAVAAETIESLWARLLEIVDALTATGLDRELLARQSMITPSCGTGGMRPDLARRSLELTAQIADKARERFLG
jgi:methionine synthase II (cobalamin-independent)